MFQITVDDAVDPDVVADSRDAGHQGAVASDHQVCLYTGCRSFVEFLYQYPVGNMVHFGKDVCLFSLSLVLDFLVDQGCQPFAHIVGRHE